MLGLLAWWVAVVFLPDGNTDAWLPDLGRYVGAELFLAAGALHVVCWRTTRLVRDLRDGIGFAAIGLSTPALAILAPWPSGANSVDAAAPLTRLIVFAPILMLLSAAAPRDARRAALAGLIPVAVLVALAVGAATPGRTLAVAVESALAVGWLGVGAQALRQRPGRPWYPISMLVMAAASAWRAATVGGASGIAHQIIPGFALVAAVLAACGAVIAVRRALRQLRDERRTVSLALLETRRTLVERDRAERERLHDARSTLFGVLGVSQLLNRSRPASALDRDSLQQMIVEELTRLQTVLDAEAVDDIVDFDLAAALAAVMLAHRVENPWIVDRLEHTSVTGRPNVTATVLDNLLRNATNHAPGAVITVRCEFAADEVYLIVEDDGPGIPAAELHTVLFPGIRGSSAQGPGSGLGLSNCVRAMAGQGGQLHLTARPGGGTRVSLTLPLALTAHCALVG